MYLQLLNTFRQNQSRSRAWVEIRLLDRWIQDETDKTFKGCFQFNNNQCLFQLLMEDPSESEDPVASRLLIQAK